MSPQKSPGPCRRLSFPCSSYQMAVPGPASIMAAGSWSWGKTEAMLERWMSMANGLWWSCVSIFPLIYMMNKLNYMENCCYWRMWRIWLSRVVSCFLTLRTGQGEKQSPSRTPGSTLIRRKSCSRRGRATDDAVGQLWEDLECFIQPTILQMGITETRRDEWDNLNQCQGIKHGLFLPQVLDVALIEKDTYVKSLSFNFFKSRHLGNRPMPRTYSIAGKILSVYQTRTSIQQELAGIWTIFVDIIITNFKQLI